MPDGRLYGRGPVVGFVGRLLKRDGVPERPLPVTLLGGPLGSGGSALLDLLAREFSDDCLSARIDVAQAQDVRDVVLVALRGLGRRIVGIRAIDFPRLKLTFKALAFPDDGGGRDAFDAHMRRRDDTLRETLERWLNRTTPLLALDQRLLVETADAALGLLASGIRRRAEDKVLDWYTGNGISTGGSRYDPLWELHLWHRERDDDRARRRVDKTLCAALLADLRSDFNDAVLLHGQRPANCLLLVDNAGGRSGDTFLDLLVECRRDAHRAGLAPDPAVVVAVQHTRIRRRTVEPVPPVDRALAAAADRPDGDHPLWLLPVGLPDLSENDVAEMAGSSVLGSLSRDADFLYALTGGHPLATDQLGVLLAHLGGTAHDARHLLDRPLPLPDDLPGHWPRDAAPDTTVGDYLITQVLADVVVLGPDGGIAPQENTLLDVMALLVATPGLRQTACEAALRSLRWDRQLAADARRALADGLWLRDQRDGSPARVHPLVTRLLQWRLARGGELWTATHRAYAAHYSKPEDEPLRRLHELALVGPGQEHGPVGPVGAYLDQAFHRAETGQERDGAEGHRAPTAGDRAERATRVRNWLRTLDLVVSAPVRPLEPRLRETYVPHDPRALVTTLAGPADPGSREQTVMRLAVARWLGGDRLVDPARRLAHVIAREYDQLAALSTDTAGEVLLQEAERYERIDELWRG